MHLRPLFEYSYNWIGNRMKLFWMFVITLLVSIIPLTLSFPSGAPQAACQTLAPDATSHGATPQDTDIPYVLNLSTFYDQATDQMVYTPDMVYDRESQSTACCNMI